MTARRGKAVRAAAAALAVASGVGVLVVDPPAHASSPPGTGAWSASVFDSGLSLDPFFPVPVWWQASGSFVGTLNMDGDTYAVSDAFFDLYASSPAENWYMGSGTIDGFSMSGTAADPDGAGTWWLSASSSGPLGTYDRVGPHLDATIRVEVELCPPSDPCFTEIHEFRVEAELGGWSLLCYCLLEGTYVQRVIPGPILPTSVPPTTVPTSTTTSTLVPPTTVPPLVKSAGAASAEGTLVYAGTGVPAAGGTCAATSFNLDGDLESVVVNTAVTHYRGPVTFSGSGSSTCDAFELGTGGVTMQFHGEAPTGATLQCPSTAGSFERRGLLWKSSVTVTCRLNGLTTPVTIQLQGLLRPDPPGAGVIGPLVNAEMRGAATVVPA